MEFLDALLSTATGGFAGLLGSVVSKVAEYFTFRQKIKLQTVTNTHELALQDRELADRQAGRKSDEKKMDITMAGQMRVASYEHDASYGTPYRWVISLLRLFRPVMTIGLIFLVWYIYRDAPSVFVTEQVLFMASAAVFWWFGDSGSRQIKKM